MNTPDGGPAFPVLESQFMTGPEGSVGMSLRDYFAASCDVSVYEPLHAAREIFGRNPTTGELAAMVSHIRYIEADAMLAAREKIPTQTQIDEMKKGK